MPLKISDKLLFPIYFLVANIYVLLSNIPLLILASRKVNDAVFPLYHPLHIEDYNGILATINMGRNGQILFDNPYTTEAAAKSVIHLFYLLVGHLSRIFHIWLPYAYHSARIISVELLIVAVYFFFGSLLDKKKTFFASILFIIITIIPSSLQNWWVYLDAIIRLNGLPHHIISYALSLISLGFFFRNKIALSSFLSFFGSLVFPPSILPILAAVFLSLIKRFRGIVIIFLAALISFIIVKWQTSHPLYKEVWVDWEIQRWNVNEIYFDRDLLMAISVLVVYSLPSLIMASRKLEWKTVFFFFWFIIPLVLLPVSTVLGVSKIRLVGITLFIPLAYFAVETTLLLFQKFTKKLAITIFSLFISFNLFSTIDYYAKFINQAKNMPSYANLYIPNTVWDVISYINKSVPPNSIILSNEFIGNILPAYTQTKSYFGHINLTLNFKKKQNDVWKFYTHAVTNEEAKLFVRENNIKYVYFGPEEKNLGQKDLTYPFLKDIYTRGNITLFKVLPIM